MDWRVLVLAVVVGVCISLATGLIEKTPESVSIPEIKYYGYPFIWRSTDPFVGEKYYHSKLLIDCLFWSALVLVAVLLAKKLMKG